MYGLTREMPATGHCWGARAIFIRGSIDLVPDRRSFRDGGTGDAAGFLSRLNASLRSVRKEAACHQWSNLRGDVAEVVVLYNHDGIVVKGSTNASHGYLYLCAYESGPQTYCEPPEGGQWSRKGPVPKLGERVSSRLGSGTVRGYFVAEGWLGVKVELSCPPDWYTKQNGARPAFLFGNELG